MGEIEMKKGVIVGVGTYGEVYAKYLSDKYHIVGFVDDNDSLIGTEIHGHVVLGKVNLLFAYGKLNVNETSVFVPIGDNSIRTKLLEQIRTFGYDTPSFIHDTVIIDSSVTLEPPIYILPGTQIMPYTHISKDVMISMGVKIAHHTTIKRGCFFSQGTNVGASILIEDLAYIGIGATLMTGVKKIGVNSLVGAGAVVIRDVPDDAVVAGVPAKVLKIKND